MRSLLLVLSVGALLALGTAAAAPAATPCWKAVLNDWYDGKIDKTYSPSCYRQAIKNVPPDVADYSSATDDIEAALLASLRGGDGKGKPPSGPGADPVERHTQSVSPQHKESSGRSPILSALDRLGPSGAFSVPLPLLILAGVAFLLLAAAGGSVANRWLQARRLPSSPEA